MSKAVDNEDSHITNPADYALAAGYEVMASRTVVTDSDSSESDDEDAALEKRYSRPSDADSAPAALPMRSAAKKHHRSATQPSARAIAKPKRKPPQEAESTVVVVPQPPDAAAADEDADLAEAAAAESPPADVTESPDFAAAAQPWTSENSFEPPAWVETLPSAVAEELALVVGVYPEAAVYPVRPPQSPVDASASADVCGCGGVGADVFEHVARLTLRLDAENVIVMLSVLVPRGFGDVEGCNPTFEVRSPNASRAVVSDVDATLACEVDEQCRNGTFSFLTFVGRASELVAGIPIGLQSDIFGFCLACANEAAKRARRQAQLHGPAAVDPATGQPPQQRKYPQPLRARQLANNDGDGAATSGDVASPLEAVRRATAAKNPHVTSAPVYECLVCHSTDNVVRIESLRPNVADEPCSFCFFEDNPIIRIDGCGCRTCFTCFSSFTNLSTGGNALRRCPRTGWVGVPCPAHSATSVITDPPLYKLCETASFLRFNRFALQRTAAEINGTECSDPRCSGIPTVSNISGDKHECSTCKEWSCVTCNCALRECTCEQWPNPAPRDHLVRSTVELISRKAETVAGDRVASRQVTMLVRFGHLSAPVTLDTADPQWLADCRRQLGMAQRLREEGPGSRTDADTARLFLVFHGVPLDGSRRLGVFPVYNGAIAYAVAWVDTLKSKELPAQRDLFEFRLQIRAALNQKKPEKVAEAEKGLYNGAPNAAAPSFTTSTTAATTSASQAPSAVATTGATCAAGRFRAVVPADVQCALRVPSVSRLQTADAVRQLLGLPAMPGRTAAAAPHADPVLDVFGLEFS
eukprot:CAMPEP_0174841274 /NCGR_PEP_ID=MMETSP1114-20130205/9206_1 /TAXON_ID=312471 /ORGANISM="Neobodo designis, Strain CCAP 1951/1" /LENGTH=811 /DNA_ID=CAMNT_0016075455 /DNA_START=101 /DNA_END=2539 /DNA_ORIENTATION=+